MRWFISYRVEHEEFLLTKRKITYHNIIIDTIPAEWVRECNNNYNILYAEQISNALASELAHGGAGIPTEYFRVEEE